MLWAVNADEFSKQELVSNGLSKNVHIEYVKDAESRIGQIEEMIEKKEIYIADF